MRIGWIRGCEIRVHPLLTVMVLLAAATGELSSMIVPFFAVLYHELMHILAAALLGYPAVSLELLPFGSLARIEGVYEEAPHAEFLIALAGPASNVLMVMVLTTLKVYANLNFPEQERFTQANLQLALFNLLPLWPMDGGRVLRSSLARIMSLTRATRLAAALGVLGGITMAAAAALGWLGKTRRISTLLLACIVILTAFKEGKGAQWLWLRELTGKKRKLMKEDTLPIRHIAVRGDLQLGRLAASFLPHRYHLVTILDEKCVPVATVSENEVVEAMMKMGAHTRIFAILPTNT